MKLTTLKSSIQTLGKSDLQTLAPPSRAAHSATRRTLLGTTLQNKRREVWTDQRGKCNVCSTVGKPSEQELDHINPLHLGGDDSRDNLQMICIPCHEKKTALELSALGKPK